jgi:hypothetical protein
MAWFVGCLVGWLVNFVVKGFPARAWDRAVLKISSS